jgi:hypothetical protein
MYLSAIKQPVTRCLPPENTPQMQQCGQRDGLMVCGRGLRQSGKEAAR